MSSQREPDEVDVRQSTIRRERRDGEWIAYEPWGDSDVQGRADTEPDAVIDYVQRLRAGDET